uniref:F-box/LRR-repeat protein 15-like leucin rich repeat domain-containing protein n=1 Tax=Populus davidiana TaxID=266767 RepID=A0A6M2EQW7_9ROSI
MRDRSTELPPECWELIFNFLDHHRHFESLSLVSTQFLSITNHLRRSVIISSQTSPFLPNLFQRFPNLKGIEIREFDGDLNFLLHQISNSGLDLESLTLSSHDHFPLMGLKELGLRMRKLRKLSCSEMNCLQDTHLFEIGNSFPLLEDLNISFPQYNSRFDPIGSLDLQRFSGIVTDEGIIHLSMKLKSLLKIDLSGNQFISDKSLQFLSENCLLLREIVIRECDFITQNGIGSVMRRCVNLNYISVDGIGMPSIELYFQESFVFAKNLSEVNLSHSFISDELLSSIADACLPLKKLTISHCYDFTFVGVSYLLYKYQFLEYLDLEGANFLTDESMVDLCEFLRKLTFINLGLCSKLTSLTFFMLVSNCSLLKDVKMERTNLGVEEFLVDYGINPCLMSLNLARNESLSDECIKKIAFCCPNLQELKISHCPTITEEGIREVLRSCGEIRHLEMNHCSGIKCLDIDFELPKLEVVQAEGPVLDDEALMMIAKRCHGLLQLDLEGCLNVTIKGVNGVVQSCMKLREINLKWCDNVKVDIIPRMVFSRPSLRKIIPPCRFIPTDKQNKFFLRHGCLVCKG